jgi:PKD repeat protein
LINKKLKAKKEDRKLRELFRHKLENAEIIPDPSVSSKLMRKLAVREFLHFSPYRFNMYYLAGIVAAGITASILLISPPARDVENQPLEIIQKIPQKENNSNKVISSGQPESGRNERKRMPVMPELRKSLKEVQEKAAEKPDLQDTMSREKNSVNSGTLNDPLKGKELFTRSVEDNNKLREMSVPGDRLFVTSVDKGCAPLKVNFKNNLSEFDSCLWTFGDGGSSSGRDPEWIYDVDGEFRVVLKVFGPDGLTSVSSQVITVYPKPSARFEVYPDKVAIPGDEVRFLNYSAGALKYFWNFGDGSTSDLFEPLHRYEKYGNYNISLKVYSEAGCSDSLLVYNAFSGSAYYIEFPNAFIPNTNGPSGGVYSSTSDESAQIFHPSYSGVSEYHLKIFSKMGVLIFETTDINIGWDGYFKGQLTNPGVYIWKVRGNFNNGEPFTKMGDVTLLKNWE